MWYKTVFLKLEDASKSPGEFEEIQIPGSHPQRFGSSRFGGGMRICMSTN